MQIFALCFLTLAGCAATIVKAQSSTPPPAAPNKARVFMQSSSHGNQWNAHRDQSMELAKDFERDCPDVRITLNQQAADYTVNLNHIEHGFARDNQFQVADKNGDLLSHTKEGGSIKNGAKKACAQILADWATKTPPPPPSAPPPPPPPASQK